MSFVVFLGAHFSYNLQFRGPFGVQVAMLFGVPGTLGNRLKTLKGYDFHALEVLFAGMISRLDRMGVFFQIFMIFITFRIPFRGVFWYTKVKNGAWQKQRKQKSNIFMRAIQLILSIPETGPMWSLKRT